MRRVIAAAALAVVCAVGVGAYSATGAEAGSCYSEPPWEPPAQVWCTRTYFYPHTPSWHEATFRTCRYYNPNPTPLWCYDTVTSYGGA